MSTPANVIAIANDKAHLFSFGSDGNPRNGNLNTIISRTLELVEGDTLFMPNWGETILRIDACYGYVIDVDNRRVRVSKAKRFKWTTKRTTERLLNLCFSQEITMQQLAEESEMPGGWQFQTGEPGDKPMADMKTIAQQWDALFTGIDALGAVWPGLSRAEQERRLMAIIPLAGFEFETGVDPIQRKGFVPLALLPSGVWGYSDDPQGQKTTRIAYAELTDPQLAASFWQWFNQVD